MIKIDATANIDKTCRIGTKGFSFTRDLPRVQEKPKGIIIEPHVYMASLCNVDKGTFRDTVIGENTIIDSHVHISHDCVIGKNCEIDTGATILGEVTIGDMSRICAGATVHQQVKVGSHCVVGAECYLRHDLPDGHTAYISDRTGKLTVKKNSETKYGKAIS